MAVNIFIVIYPLFFSMVTACIFLVYLDKGGINYCGEQKKTL